MVLDNILHKIERAAKTILFVGAMGFVLSSSHCITSHSSNKEPDTFITRQFNKTGGVNYSFSASDTDGSIDYIAVRFNNLGVYQNFSNNTSTLVPINEGNNTIEAIAYDDEGKADSTPATDLFNSPSEETAKQIIEESLTEKAGAYADFKKNALISLGEKDSFYADYLIRKKDGTDAVINYTGYQKDLATELQNKVLLDECGIPNLHLVRIPTDEIQLQIEDFINNDFQ